MKTTFVRKPCCLKDLLADRDTLRGWHDGQDMSEYYIAAEKHLTASEWSDFTDDLLADREWIAAFAALGYAIDNGVTPCLRVTGDGSQIALLIDPSGYSYARYAGVEEAPESSPSPAVDNAL